MPGLVARRLERVVASNERRGHGQRQGQGHGGLRRALRALLGRMIVGTARVVLSLPGNDSLKGKRKVLRRILDRVRHKHNAAIAEVDAMDDHRRAVIGLSVISNDGRHASSMLDKVLDFVEASSEVPVVERRTELLNLGTGDHFGMEADWDLEAEERWLSGSEDG